MLRVMIQWESQSRKDLMLWRRIQNASVPRACVCACARVCVRKKRWSGGSCFQPSFLQVPLPSQFPCFLPPKFSLNVVIAFKEAIGPFHLLTGLAGGSNHLGALAETPRILVSGVGLGPQFEGSVRMVPTPFL